MTWTWTLDLTLMQWEGNGPQYTSSMKDSSSKHKQNMNCSRWTPTAAELRSNEIGLGFQNSRTEETEEPATHERKMQVTSNGDLCDDGRQYDGGAGLCCSNPGRRTHGQRRNPRAGSRWTTAPAGEGAWDLAREAVAGDVERPERRLRQRRDGAGEAPRGTAEHAVGRCCGRPVAAAIVRSGGEASGTARLAGCLAPTPQRQRLPAGRK